jgi:tryptophan synthase alpha subunit
MPPLAQRKLSNKQNYEHLDAYLARVRANTQKEICSRLWDSNAQSQLEWILERADGAVIGSQHISTQLKTQ